MLEQQKPKEARGSGSEQSFGLRGSRLQERAEAKAAARPTKLPVRGSRAFEIK